MRRAYPWALRLTDPRAWSGVGPLALQPQALPRCHRTNRFHPPRFLRGVGLDSRLGPRCRSSSGKPVGCGASLGPVRDCSRVSWAPSILRTPFCRRSASPAPSRRPSTEPEFFLRHRPKPFPQGSDRRRTFSPGGDASPKRCVAVADRTMMGHKNEVGPIWRPTLVHNVATAVIHNC